MVIESTDTNTKISHVLARKWRPKSFAQLVGQDIIVRALQHALLTNCLHHAYLLTGNRGVGKTTIARLVAKAVNCKIGEKNEPCTKCKICVEIDSGRFIDVIEIDAASNRGVEEIQQVLERTKYAPSIGLRKVIVIDEVHMLSNHAFNAMLKTLEEPPNHIIFILATTDPQKIPSTVVSRCLQFVLKNISSDFIANHLSDILLSEKIIFEKSALKRIAEAADGSMRDALSITDQAIACGNGAVKELEVIEMLGLVQKDGIDRLVVSIADNNAKRTLEQAEDLLKNGVSSSSLLEELAKVFHKASIFLSLPDYTNEELNQSVHYLCQNINSETAQLYYQIVILGRRDLRLAPDDYVGIEMTLIRLFTMIPKRISELNITTEKPAYVDFEKKNPNSSSNTLKESNRSEKKISIKELKPSNWVSLAGSFQVEGLLRQFFYQATLVEINREAVLTLKFMVPLTVLNELSLIERARSFLLKKFDLTDLKVEVAVGESSNKNLADTEREISNERRNNAEKKLKEFSLTKKIMKNFNAKIIQDSVKPNNNP